MPEKHLLDTGPLGLLAHDRPAHRLPIQTWLLEQLAAGATIYLSEIADYEVRHELTRLVQSGNLPASRLDRLDQLDRVFAYLPASTAAWRRAATLWATTRSQGKPTADPAALDADVLIAAQALEVQATVVTCNPKHLKSMVPIHSWPCGN